MESSSLKQNIYPFLDKPIRVEDQQWDDSIAPLVSISCITYNHANYIRNAIDGFLLQETTFKIEILIHDDASFDGTTDIIRDYEVKYPKLIKPIYQKENQYSKTGFAFSYLELARTKGKYIALCEGDDYWTDSLKLQKQVTFLEANKNFSFCFHNAETIFCDTGLKKPFNQSLKSDIYTTKNLLLKGWIIPTASLCFRKEWLPEIIPEWHYTVKSGDYALELLLSTYGPFYYMNQKMSVYRKNSVNSRSINLPSAPEIVKNHLSLLRNFQKTSDNKYTKFAIVRTKYNLIKVCIYNKFPFIVTLKNKLFN